MSRYLMYNKGADFAGLAEKLGVDPVVVRLMVNRDVAEEEMKGFLSPSLSMLHDPHLLKDMDRAVSVLLSSIENKEKIRIIGDYDIDGIFATYILHSALSRAGAESDFYIPDRKKDGYGMNISMVENAAKDGVGCIITCDNGIKAYDEAKRAKELGIRLVVTDHHELGFSDGDGEKQTKLPDCDAAVDPHRDDCTYPFPEICGAVVAWKLMFALYEACGIDRKEALAFIGFAAFATIGDIMPLRDENRVIVSCGLKELSSGTNIGIRALIARCFEGEKELNPYDVGFVLGPCFNASGRLKSARLGVELLEETDEKRAIERAEEIRVLNEQRKAMTEEGEKRAYELLEKENRFADPIYVVFVPELHESLAGIVAGRIRENYDHPAYVLTRGANGIKGSGRSVPAYSMAKKLHDVADLLTHYGGHPMAAGITLADEKDIAAFRTRLNEKAELSEKDLARVVHIDMQLPLSYISEGLIESIERLEPYGEGNPKPVFAVKAARPDHVRTIGREDQYLKLRFGTLDAVYFGDGQEILARWRKDYSEEAVDALLAGKESGITLTFTYYPQINEFRGMRSPQIRIIDFIPAKQ